MKFSNDKNRSKVTINLSNCTKDTRVHVFVNQFTEQIPMDFYEALKKGIQNEMQGR